MKKMLALVLIIPIISISQNRTDTLLKQIQLEAKPVYVKAKTEISELRNLVDLAKKGLINKNSVVNKFNELVGPIMGIQSSFNAIDKRLKNAGDAYVDFMFKKELARIANKRAAEL